MPAAGPVGRDIALEKAAAQLEAVVTTATGLQSRREVGTVVTAVVATVRADSIAAEAPVTNIAELLQARTAGGAGHPGERFARRGASIPSSNAPGRGDHARLGLTSRSSTQSVAP